MPVGSPLLLMLMLLAAVGLSCGGVEGQREKDPTRSPTESVTITPAPTVTVTPAPTRTASASKSVQVPPARPLSAAAVITRALLTTGVPESFALRATGFISFSGLVFGFATPTGSTTAPSIIAIAATADCRYGTTAIDGSRWYLSFSPPLVYEPGEQAPEHPDANSSRTLVGPIAFGACVVVAVLLVGMLFQHMAPEWRVTRMAYSAVMRVVTGHVLVNVSRMSATIYAHPPPATQEPIGSLLAAAFVTAVCVTVVATLGAFLLRYARDLPKRHPPGTRPKPPRTTSPLFTFTAFYGAARDVRHPQCRLLVVVDLATALLIGFVGGMRPGARSCAFVSVVQIVLTATVVVWFAVYAVHRTLRDAVFFYALSLVQIAVGFGALWAHLTEGEEQAFLAYGLLTVFASFVLVSLFVVVVLALELFDARQRERDAVLLVAARNRALGLPADFGGDWRTRVDPAKAKQLGLADHLFGIARAGAGDSGSDGSDDLKLTEAQVAERKRLAEQRAGLDAIDRCQVAHPDGPRGTIDGVKAAAPPPPPPSAHHRRPKLSVAQRNASAANRSTSDDDDGGGGDDAGRDTNCTKGRGRGTPRIPAHRDPTGWAAATAKHRDTRAPLNAHLIDHSSSSEEENAAASSSSADDGGEESPYAHLDHPLLAKTARHHRRQQQQQQQERLTAAAIEGAAAGAGALSYDALARLAAMTPGLRAQLLDRAGLSGGHGRIARELLAEPPPPPTRRPGERQPASRRLSPSARRRRRRDGGAPSNSSSSSSLDVDHGPTTAVDIPDDPDL